MDGKVSVDLDSHKVCQLKDCALLQHIEDRVTESESGLEDWLAGEMKRFEDSVSPSPPPWGQYAADFMQRCLLLNAESQVFVWELW
jgi:hypothetical protein